MVPSKGYRVGGGQGMLYAAKPNPAFATLFDNLSRTHAAEAGIDACSICMGELNGTDELVRLPCNPGHAFRSKCIKEWLWRQLEPSCPICREPVGDVKAGAKLPPGTLPHGGDLLEPIGHVRPVLTKAEVARKLGGAGYPYMGGLGFYPVEHGAVSSEPLLRFDGSTVYKGLGKEAVAKCAPWFGDRPTSKRVGVAPGVEGLLVLALLSEWDANRRGSMTDPDWAPGS